MAKFADQRQKLSATLMFKNGHNGRLLVDFLRPRPPRRKPHKRVSACEDLTYLSAPPGTRTPNLLIKSQLLYQLS